MKKARMVGKETSGCDLLCSDERNDLFFLIHYSLFIIIVMMMMTRYATKMR